MGARITPNADPLDLNSYCRFDEFDNNQHHSDRSSSWESDHDSDHLNHLDHEHNDGRSDD